MPIFTSAERRIYAALESAARMMSIEHDCATFRAMARIRAVVRISRDHPYAADATLAFALAALALSDVFTSGGYLTGSKWVYVPTALAMTVPLAWRRRTPLLVVALVMAAFAAQSLILDPTPTPDSELIPALVAVYSVAVHGQRWAPFVGGGVGVAAGLIWLGVDDFLLTVVLFGGAWLAGRLVQKRQLYAQAFATGPECWSGSVMRTRVSQLPRNGCGSRESCTTSSGTASASWSCRPGAERLALGGECPSTREVLLAIERTGREALAEMSRLLGILRTQSEGLALAPRPSLAQVDVLVQTLRDAGVPVVLDVEGEPSALPPSVDVSAYRVVQEALTNVVKHAHAARALVVVRYGRRAVEVEIIDDGNGSANGNAAGYGLAGMRERVELHGGTLEAGNRSEGGFCVKARLPLELVQR